MEPHEGATHASWSEFCLVFSLIVFMPSNADRECVATTLKICLFSDIHSSPDRDVHVRARICTVQILARKNAMVHEYSVQTIRGLLSCKQRVGDVILVKTLVWRLPGLPDLFRRPWVFPHHADQLFGGCSCLLFEDFGQLPPVMDPPGYTTLS